MVDKKGNRSKSSIESVVWAVLNRNKERFKKVDGGIYCLVTTDAKGKVVKVEPPVQHPAKAKKARGKKAQAK